MDGCLLSWKVYCEPIVSSQVFVFYPPSEAAKANSCEFKKNLRASREAPFGSVSIMCFDYLYFPVKNVSILYLNTFTAVVLRVGPGDRGPGDPHRCLEIPSKKRFSLLIRKQCWTEWVGKSHEATVLAFCPSMRTFIFLRIFLQWQMDTLCS